MSTVDADTVINSFWKFLHIFAPHLDPDEKMDAEQLYSGAIWVEVLKPLWVFSMKAPVLSSYHGNLCLILSKFQLPPVVALPSRITREHSEARMALLFALYHSIAVWLETVAYTPTLGFTIPDLVAIAGVDTNIQGRQAVAQMNCLVLTALFNAPEPTGPQTVDLFKKKISKETQLSLMNAMQQCGIGNESASQSKTTVWVRLLCHSHGENFADFHRQEHYYDLRTRLKSTTKSLESVQKECQNVKGQLSKEKTVSKELQRRLAKLEEENSTEAMRSELRIAEETL
jgi:hypothetical protein